MKSGKRKLCVLNRKERKLKKANGNRWVILSIEEWSNGRFSNRKGAKTKQFGGACGEKRIVGKKEKRAPRP